MKRKWWIVLALAAVLALLCCGAAMAEWGERTIQLFESYPQSLTMDVGETLTVRVTISDNPENWTFLWYILETDSYIEYLEESSTIPNDVALKNHSSKISEIDSHAIVTVSTIGNEVSIQPTDDWLDGQFLFCVATNKNVGYYSSWDCTDPIPLTVIADKPYIASQPKNTKTQVGTEATISIWGMNEYEYYWYVCDESHTLCSWSTVSSHASYRGELTRQLIINPSDTWLNGKYAYCLVKNRFGKAIYSDYAQITVEEPSPTMVDYIECPESDYLYEGNTYVFVIHSTTAVEYDWHVYYTLHNVDISYHADGNTLYLQPTKIEAGGEDSTLNLVCYLKRADCDVAEEVSLDRFKFSRQSDAYTIISAPDQYVSAEVGETIEARFDVANGNTFEWHISDANASTITSGENTYLVGFYTWDEVREHVEVTGLGTSCITLCPTDTWLSGKILQLEKINGYNIRYNIRITIREGRPAINTQGSVSVVSLTGYNAADAAFTAHLDGNLANMREHLTYQWQYLTAGDDHWTNIGNPEREGRFESNTNYTGRFLRVKVTADNMEGELYSSAIRLLTPRISGDLEVTAPGGEPVRHGDTLHAELLNSTASSPVYGWQRSSDNESFTDIPESAGSNYATAAEDVGRYVRAKATANGYNGAVYSGSVYVEPAQCTVSFEMNGHGTQIASQTVLENETATRPETPTAQGYQFVNWYTNPACTKVFTFSTPITEDTVIYLHWAKCITVSFVPNGGTGTMEDINLLAMNYITLPECGFTPPQGAVFKAWRVTTGTLEFQPGESRQTFDDITYCPVWAGPYTVTFDADGGSGDMAAVTVGHGEAYTLPACGFTPPVGKKFGNWNVEIGDSTTLLWPGYALTVYQNITLKPDWRVARATFQANGGTGILSPVDMLPDSSGYITLPECSLTPPSGRMFTGWLVGGTVYQPGQRAPLYGDTLIPAQWTDAHYTVTFDKNGGSGTMSSFVTNGDSITLPECGFTAPAGKQFNYWIVSAAVTNYKLYYPGQTVQINADTTVQAIWTNETPSTVTLSFNSGDGSGSMASLTVPYNTPFALPECGFTPPAGQVFSIWNFHSGYHNPGEQVSFTEDTVAVALYRVPNTYTVTFDNRWHGTAPAEQTVAEGQYVVDPGDLSEAGYTFNGWTFSYAVGSGSDYTWETIPFDFALPIDYYMDLAGVSSGITLSADWTEHALRLTLNVSDGGTASIRNAKETWQYGNGIYVDWEADSGCYLESITMIPMVGEPVDVTIPEFQQPNFTMPDCDVAVEVRFTRPQILSGSFGDGLYWSLSEGHLTIGGVGAMPDFTWENEAPWMAWKNEIYGVEIQPGITAVGKLAFAEINSLGYTSIPDTVTRINSMAFYCCNALGGITLPDGLTVLGDSAFQETAISMVDIPAGVRVIDESAFAGCVNLSSVTLHEGLEKIGDSAFGYCESITEITIPQSVINIGTYVFDNCTSLQRVSGLEHVGQLPGGLFCECVNLTDIGLLPRVAVIPGDAFARCRSLSSIAIPSTVTRIEDWAFDECDSLTAVYYEGSRAMWDAITIGTNNDALLSATLYCKLTISFETNGGSAIPDQLIDYGECPEIPEMPFLAGSQFTGWFLEASLDTSYDFSDPLYADTILYADWFSPSLSRALRLPAMLTEIEAESFSGVSAEVVIVPKNVTTIAPSAFPDTIEYVMGYPGTAAETWANAHGVAFIEIDDAWMASH